jgi:hybrid cluster-associated redox disulfide protein
MTKPKKKKKEVKNKVSKKKLSITKKMTFTEVMEKSPEAAQVLFGKGMHCVGCGMAGFETIEQGAIMHGIDADELVKEMNNKIRDKK